MEKKTLAKLIIAVLMIIAIAFGLYLRWQTDEWDTGWGKGNLTISERTYYFGGINRIIESWQQTRSSAERERGGRLKDSYKIYLVIDLDKKAFWIEENGQVRAENYIELAPKMKWTLSYFTPTSDTVLSGRTILKIRGYNTRQITPEKFFLVGRGAESYIHFQFDSNSRGGESGSGSFNKPSMSFKSSSANEDDLYGSIIVSEDEYQQYCDSLPDSIVSQTNEDNAQSEILTELEANKAAWSRIEKHLYMEIDRQVQAAGYELRRLTVEPSPDFTAGHSKFVYFRSSIMYKLFDGSISVLRSYLIFNHLGNDIWYVKSGIDPEDPVISSNNFEFLVSLPNNNIQSTQYNELLQKGRKIQQSGTIPESK